MLEQEVEDIAKMRGKNKFIFTKIVRLYSSTLRLFLSTYKTFIQRIFKHKCR